MLKKLFRYPLADGYMLFSYVIAYIALFFSLTLSSDIRDFDQDIARYTYRSAYDFTMKAKSSNVKIEKTLSNRSGLIQIEDFPVFLTMNEEKLNTYCSLLLKGEDLSMLPILQGDIRSILIEKASIAVGKLFSETYHLKIGDTITIGTESYRVVAIIGTENSEYMSDSLWLSYDMAHSGIERTLRNMDQYHVRYSNTDGKAYNSYLETYNTYNGLGWEIVPIGGVKQKAADYMDMRGLIYFGIYAFSLLQCVIASELWVYVRRYETAVRRALGFSRRQLILVMFRQLLRVSLFAIVLCYGVQYVAILLNGGIFGIHIRPSLINLGLIFGFGIFTAAVSLILPLRFLGKESAAVSMQKGSDGV